MIDQPCMLEVRCTTRCTLLPGGVDKLHIGVYLRHLTDGNYYSLGACHGSTGSPSALMRRVLRGGVTFLEGAGILARGTRSCT